VISARVFVWGCYGISLVAVPAGKQAALAVRQDRSYQQGEDTVERRLGKCYARFHQQWFRDLRQRFQAPF
jgi:hypothetical protein